MRLLGTRCPGSRFEARERKQSHPAVPRSAFNTFAAMFSGGNFGPTVKLSPELSEYPPLTYAGNYGNGNGGGDFTTWVTANDTDAFVAFP